MQTKKKDNHKQKITLYIFWASLRPAGSRKKHPSHQPVLKVMILGTSPAPLSNCSEARNLAEHEPILGWRSFQSCPTSKNIEKNMYGIFLLDFKRISHYIFNKSNAWTGFHLSYIVITNKFPGNCSVFWLLRLHENFRLS